MCAWTDSFIDWAQNGEIRYIRQVSSQGIKAKIESFNAPILIISMPTLVLADDHNLVRSALRVMLEQTSNFTVVGEARDNDSALASALAHAPDLLVLDLGLHGLPLPQLCIQLRQSLPRLKILVLTGDSSAASAKRALSAGADGYAIKSDDASALVGAMQAVLQGDAYVGSVDLPARPAGNSLTAREREVLSLACGGLSSPAIALRLNLAPGTVRKHRENLMRKLGVRNTAQMTTFALRDGLIV
jgi:DNA-binding NarL/FixJ family response regulator